MKHQGRFPDRKKSPHAGGRADFERRHLSGPVEGSSRPLVIVKRARGIKPRRIGGKAIVSPRSKSRINKVDRPHIVENLREDLIAIRGVFRLERSAKPGDRPGTCSHFLKVLIHALILNGVILLIALGIFTGQVVTDVVRFIPAGVLGNRGGKGEQFVKRRPKLVIVMHRPDGDPGTTEQVEFRRAAVGREEKADLFQGSRSDRRIEHGPPVYPPAGALGRKHHFIHGGVQMLCRDVENGHRRVVKLIRIFRPAFGCAIPVRREWKDLVNCLFERPVGLVAIWHNAIRRRYSPQPSESGAQGSGGRMAGIALVLPTHRLRRR